MSELSTVAIKDGHRGHLHNHHGPFDAERADRISRLAGLDRMGPRGQGSLSTAGQSGGDNQLQRGQNQPQGAAYFDANNTPQIMRERSTVGSASATGSVGGRTTTWASGSNDGDLDKESEDMDVDNSSIGGFSDEGAASLVGFGEGARTPARPVVGFGSPVVPKSQLARQGTGDRMDGLERVEDGVTPPATED
jgi:hypothetical protein